MFFVYILVSELKGLRFYVGMTENIERRKTEHNGGKVKSTKGYIPWKLFSVEKFKTRIEAREREKYLKSGSAKERIKDKWFRSSVG